MLFPACRYVHIFHRSLLEDFGHSDSFFVWSVRGANVAVNGCRTAMLVALKQEPR